MDPNQGMPYMLSVEEAKHRILGMFQPLEPERKPILQALGQVLAEDVVSTLDIPPLANSAMDGYAVQAADLVAASGENPVTLPVAFRLQAGDPATEPLAPGSAARIMTGAPLPAGARA